MKRLLALAVLAMAAAACEPPPPALFRAVAFGEIVRAQAEAGDAAGAGRTAGLALEAAQSMTKRGYRLEALGAAAVARTRAGDPTAAFEIAERLAEPDDRAAAFVALALARADMGDEPGALAAIDRAMGLADTLADGRDRGRIRALAARAQVTAGDVAGARDTLEIVADMKTRAGAMAEVAVALVEAGDLTAGLETALAIPNVEGDDDVTASSVLLRGLAVGVHRALDALVLNAEMPPRVRALTLVALAQADSVREYAVGQTFALAVESAQAIERVSGRRKALEGIALAQAGTGDAETALRTLREAADGLDPAKEPFLVAVAQAVGGDSLAALETLRGIEKDDRADGLLRVAMAEIAADRIWAAEDTLDLLLEAANSDQDQTHPGLVWVLSRVAVAQAAAGDQAVAARTAATGLDIARTVTRSGDRALALLLVAAAQAEARDIAGALATARLITGPD